MLYIYIRGQSGTVGVVGGTTRMFKEGLARSGLSGGPCRSPPQLDGHHSLQYVG